MKKKTAIVLIAISLLILACNLPTPAPQTPPTTQPTTTIPATPTTPIMVTNPATAIETVTPDIIHVLYPAASAPSSKRVYDVTSVDTAPEKRAPYGDSYKINLLERPFQQNMTYVSDLDIITFNVSSDSEWYYVSIELVGKNPNNEMGIHYGVEIDNDADGFGDIIVWAGPPYTQDWTNENVQVFRDNNHNTAGLSAVLSDAPLETDGYETPIFDLSGGLVTDPDLAWVRTTFSMEATLQFAFKRSLTDESFMLGVIADAGLQDVGKLDYIDRFLEKDAGSPVKNNQYYPLGELYLVDNTCREAFGFEATGYEPRLCPREIEPTAVPGNPEGSDLYCYSPLTHEDQASCEAAACVWHETLSQTTGYTIGYCSPP